MKKKRFLFILILLIVFVCMPVYADDTASGVTCQSMLGDLLFQIKQVYGYVRIVVPVLLILLTSLDFAKVVLSDSKDGMDKAKSNFLKRAIAALIIFFAPNILELIAYIIDGPSEIAACLDELEHAQLSGGARPNNPNNPTGRQEDPFDPTEENPGDVLVTWSQTDQYNNNNFYVKKVTINATQDFEIEFCPANSGETCDFNNSAMSPYVNHSYYDNNYNSSYQCATGHNKVVHIIDSKAPNGGIKYDKSGSSVTATIPFCFSEGQSVRIRVTYLDKNGDYGDYKDLGIISFP